ncbi:phosphoribosylanthranilate isomerase [Gillisia sp. M10.2A]|uniref:N-(5'-phosphoribosyl)anthranilate isomerase n=1 Tax=Gillisia lutea TaxID=2909668 RepID=A0ABS9EHZ1_9FLAO|nr:phosphoribosylanthranilate isomerase [Gillisia lutea]MCF4102461.1 phosphoribosylanthranilate isomerase [Gillisia lutea]
MEQLKLKICGMGTAENILAVAALQPDYLGFIFFEASPRNFDGVIPKIDPSIKKTGVFVNASLEFILKKVDQYQLNAIQLHGEESAAFCEKLKAAWPDKPIELIKVFSIKDHFNFEELEAFEGKVDYFLFDTKGKNKGGNGFTFNWEVLKDYPSKTPFFLSGGIGLEETNKLKEFSKHLNDNGKLELLHALDVNSKFELRPGLKNIEELKQFQTKLNFQL